MESSHTTMTLIYALSLAKEMLELHPGDVKYRMMTVNRKLACLRAEDNGRILYVSTFSTSTQPYEDWQIIKTNNIIIMKHESSGIYDCVHFARDESRHIRIAACMISRGESRITSHSQIGADKARAIVQTMLRAVPTEFGPDNSVFERAFKILMSNDHMLEICLLPSLDIHNAVDQALAGM